TPAHGSQRSHDGGGGGGSSGGVMSRSSCLGSREARSLVMTSGMGRHSTLCGAASGPSVYSNGAGRSSTLPSLYGLRCRVSCHVSLSPSAVRVGGPTALQAS